MKRKGFLLLEALAGLLLISALAASVFPLAGRVANLLALDEIRGKMGETGLFAMDFMTEKIRNTKNTAVQPLGSSSYTYYAKNERGAISPYERGAISPYRFSLNQEKLKLTLYNGLVEPVTGEKSGSGEEIPLAEGEKGLFRRQALGPLHISFTLGQAKEGQQRDFETSILPYADFYEKGKIYE